MSLESSSRCISRPQAVETTDAVSCPYQRLSIHIEPETLSSHVGEFDIASLDQHLARLLNHAGRRVVNASPRADPAPSFFRHLPPDLIEST